MLDTSMITMQSAYQMTLCKAHFWATDSMLRYIPDKYKIVGITRSLLVQRACEWYSNVWPLKGVPEPAFVVSEYWARVVGAKQRAAIAMHDKQCCAESADDHGRILEKILTDFEHDPWMEIPETPNEYNVVIRKGTVSAFVNHELILKHENCFLGSSGCLPTLYHIRTAWHMMVLNILACPFPTMEYSKSKRRL